MKWVVEQGRYGIIADDLTGATDAASAFAECGWTAAVALEPRCIRSLQTQVVAFSTHSRHDLPAIARRKVRRTFARLRGIGITRFYKKIDSTVQGNIVAEVEAARDAGEFDTAIVCPANPVQGRTVRRGILHVRGSHTVNLHDRFRSQGLAEFASITLPISAAKVARIVQQGHPFILADATSKRDLACLVRSILRSKQRVLLAGSAAMAAELARLSFNGHSTSWNPDGTKRSSPGRLANGCSTLVIHGSNNKVSWRQAELLVAKMRAARLMLNHHTSREATLALSSNRHAIIRVAMHCQSKRVICRRLKALTPLFTARLVGSLLLVGGDTALLICRCLRPLGIAIRGEIVPGLAWGEFIGGLADGLTVCTKPGGFGSDHAVVRAVRFLNGWRFRKPRDRFGIPSGVKATLHQIGNDPLVFLDAVLKSPSSRY